MPPAAFWIILVGNMSNFSRHDIDQNKLIKLTCFLDTIREEVEPMGVDLGPNFLNGRSVEFWFNYNIFKNCFGLVTCDRCQGIKTVGFTI